MAGKAPKRKGNRLEQALVRTLKAELNGRTMVLECKARQQFKTLESWLEDRDAVVLKPDRRGALVLLRLNDLLALLTEP